MFSDYNTNDAQGKACERAFTSALRWWFGLHDSDERQIRIQRIIPDTIHIDFTSDVDADGQPETEGHIAWQVKSTRDAYKISKEAVHVTLETRHVRDLYFRGFADSTPIILVVGCKPMNVKDNSTPDREQFIWYGIDIVQYVNLRGVDFTRCARTLTIAIPLQNELNAATVSLLWGSFWTARMLKFVQHSDSLVRTLKEIGTITRQAAFRDESLVGRIAKETKEGLAKLPPNIQAIASTSIGLSGTTLDSLGRIAKSRVGTYQNIATEVAGPWVNFWLFNRQYRNFLDRALFMQMQNKKAIRYVFPVNLVDNGHHLRLAVAHVIEERCVNPYFKIDIQDSHLQDLTDDLTTLGPGIGLQNFYLGKRDGFVVEQLSEAQTRSAYDKFASIEPNKPGMSLPLLTEGLSHRDIRLGNGKPWALLAPESDLLEHPVGLWRQRIGGA